MSVFRIFPLLLFSVSAFASQNPTITFNIDNDGIFGVDRDYTSGVFFTFTSGAVRPTWLTLPFSLALFGAPSLDKVEVTLGHKMWTPSDIELETPEPNERPYAGLLHSEFSYISLHPMQAQRFSFLFGTTGENAFSEQAQKFIHTLTKSTDPNGWAYQIEDKVVTNFGYTGHFNISRRRDIFGTEVELSNISEVNYGDYRSDVSTGVMLRWGRDLAGNFGSAGISVENPFRAGMIGASNFGWFLFGGIEGRYRFNDITIEGERPLEDLEYPASYYEVSLQRWQATAVVGAAWYSRFFAASLTTTLNTREFKEDGNLLHGTGGLSFYAFF